MPRELPNRKRLRLEYFDYNSPGAYFITICTHNRKCTLSKIVGAIHESPLRSRSTISKTIGYIKMNATKAIHLSCKDEIVWQRGYYDHVIRDRNDYEKIVKYIYENPVNWFYDELYTKE